MSVGTETCRSEYTGNGATVDFPTGFYFFAPGELLVSLQDPGSGPPFPQVLDVDYTVTGAGDVDGGTVTFTVAPLNTFVVRIDRNVLYLQLLNLQTSGPFSPDAITAALDKLTMLAQQLHRDFLDLDWTGSITDGVSGLVSSYGAGLAASVTAAVVAVFSPAALWTPLSLTAPWANVGGPYETAAYHKDAFGFVHLRGVVAGAALGTFIGTLPAGYRPTGDKFLPVACDTTTGIVQVQAYDGKLGMVAGQFTFVSLEGIQFPAA